MSIALAMFFLTIILMTTFAFTFAGRENLLWVIFAIPVGTVFLGRAWMNQKISPGLRVLRFDKGFRNFQFVRGKEIISFQSDEVRYLKTEDDENYFEVRGISLSFPTRVYASGNFLTGLYLSGTNSNIFALAGRWNSSRAFSFNVGFENGALKAWAETLTGERCGPH